jgi:hypothetical protein
LSSEESIVSSVTVNGLRVRLQPNGEILDHLSIGDEVTIIGYDEATGRWAYVDHNEDGEADGFVHSDYLTIDGFNVTPDTTMSSVEMFGVSCGANGSTASDSAERLCAFPYGGGMIYYAHNYTSFGKTIEGLSSNIGARIQLNVDGNFLGEYEVISSHQATGTAISNILSRDALSSANNQFVTLVTTNKAKEAVDPFARIVVTLELVE